MKKLQIYEPAMCCPTGICGVGVDPELLRMSTVVNTLKKNKLNIERFNLTNSPMEFVNNQEVNKLINESGVEKLPVTLLDGQIVLIGRYPTNDELTSFLEVPKEILAIKPRVVKISRKSKESNGCDCTNGECK